MEKLLDKLNKFFFGKYLKLILLLIGIGFCIADINPYRNPEAEVVGVNIRYGITAAGLIFSAVFIHLKEIRNKLD